MCTYQANLLSILATIQTLLYGCSAITESSASPRPIIVCRTPDQEVRVVSGGLGEITLSYTVSNKSDNREQFTRSYRIECAEDEVNYLCAVVRALSCVNTDAKNNPDAMLSIMLYERGRPDILFAFDSLALDVHPIWNAVYEECRLITQSDLVEALFYKEVAQLLFSQDNSSGAALLYDAALSHLIDWRIQRWKQSGMNYIEDAELAISKPRSLRLSSRYRESIDEYSQSWAGLIENVTINVEDDVLRVQLLKDKNQKRRQESS